MKPKVALVLGAGGFVGTNLVRHFLGAGWNVIGMGHKTTLGGRRVPLGSYREIPEHISASALAHVIEKPYAVIFCAGGPGVGFAQREPLKEFGLSVQSCAATLEYIRTVSPQSHFIFCSSAAVYGNHSAESCRESQKTEPISIYGSYRLLCEQLCQSYAKQYQIITTSVRIFSAYGPGLRKQLLWDACRKFAAGENSFSGTGKELRDFIHINDVARLMLQLSESPRPKEPVVNCGTGIAISVSEILSHLHSLMGKGPKPHFSGSTDPSQPQTMLADTTLGKALGFRPQVDWKTGVAEYAAWFKQSGIDRTQKEAA